MNKVLITGATGLIGRSLVARLSRSHEVVPLARKNSSSMEQFKPAHLAVDLAGAEFIQYLPAGVSTVVHLAQSDHYRSFPEQAQDIFDVNVRSTALLLEWARNNGVQRFVLASSGGIYGHGDEAFTEEHAVTGGGPLGYYLSSKHCAEMLAESYSSYMSVITLRFFFVYGPWQRSSMLVPRLIANIQEGNPIELQSADGIKLNPIYVEDAAAAIADALLLRDSQKINIAGSEVLSIRRIAEIIGGIVNAKPIFTRSSTDPRNIVADIRKMQRLLMSPQTNFASGVRKVLSA